MFGNYLADRTSVGDYRSVDQVSKNVRSLIFTADEVMELITREPIWYWANAAGRATL